jgi:tetratricopeptide (TPR) repeat protein
MSHLSRTVRFAAAALIAASIGPSLDAQEVDITASSRDAFALFERGRDAFHRTWFERADELLAEAVAVEPDLAIAQAYKATTETFLYFDASERMERAIELAEEASPGERLMVSALAAFADGDFESTALTLREIISLFPDDRWARHALGFTLVDLGMPDHAIPVLTELIEDHPGFVAPWNHLGYAYLDVGELSLAKQSASRFITADPENPSARDSWADVMVAAGDLDAAIASLTRALLLDPQYGYAMQHLGDVLMIEGQPQMARTAYRTATQIAARYSPRFTIVTEERIAGTWIRQLQFDEADAVLGELASTAQEHGEAASTVTAHRAQLLIHLTGGDASASERVLEAYTDSLHALGEDAGRYGEPAYYDFFQGWRLVVAGRYEAAGQVISNLESASQHRGSVEHQLAARLLGELALAQLDYTSAIEAFEELRPGDPLIAVRLALAYEGDGKPAAAQALFDAAAACESFDIECALASALAMPLFPTEWILPDYGVPSPEDSLPEDDPDDNSVTI